VCLFFVVVVECWSHCNWKERANEASWQCVNNLECVAHPIYTSAHEFPAEKIYADLCWGWLNTEVRVSEVAAGISVCWFWSWTDQKTDKEWRVVVLASQLAWYEWFQCFEVPPKNQSVRSCGLWGIGLKTGIAVTGGSESKSIKQAKHY
jgi:hypothetical protein